MFPCGVVFTSQISYSSSRILIQDKSSCHLNWAAWTKTLLLGHHELH